jgi:hypothetical protein
MRNAVIWNVTPFGSFKVRRFGGTYRLHHQGDKIGEPGTLPVLLRSLLQLPVTANVPGSQILVTLMMKAIRSNGTSALTRVTRHNIPEDGILRNKRL